MRPYKVVNIAKKKLPLLLTSFAIHCLTKSFRFLFPNAPLEPRSPNMRKPRSGNQHRKKETSPLSHFVRNSLPHKKLPLFVPQCSSGTTISQHMKPRSENQHRKKETSPLAHFVRNSLPHKKLPLFVPQCSSGTTISQHTKPRSGNQHMLLFLRSFKPSSLKRLFPPSLSSSAHCASSIPCSDCK